MNGAWLVPLLVLGSLAPSTARARDVRDEAVLSPRARVGVLVVEDPSTDWGRRVQGQLSDLPASVEIRTAPTLVAGDEAALTAEAATAAAGRALTAWLETGAAQASTDGGTFIVIWFAGTAEPYARRIAGDWEMLSASDRSAALELAALSVRSAVRSLLLDQAADGARSQPSSATLASASQRSPAQRVSVPAAPGTHEIDAAAKHDMPRAMRADEPEPVRSGSVLPVRLGLEVGAAYQFYGRTALGAPGVRGGVQLLGEAWSFEVMGQYGLPVSASVDSASFDLQRHAALAELSFAAVDAGAWRFGPLLRAGLSWLRRDDSRSDASSAALQAARAQSHRSPFVGAGAIAQQQLSASLSLSLRAALNVETAIPTFTLVDTSGAPVSSGSPWSVQPSLEIGASWRL